MQTHRVRLALGAGVALPLVYFGVQALAAPFYPGFSLVGTTASDLGSPQSRLPAVLNAGALLCGLLGLGAAAGYAGALRRLRVGIWPTALLVGALVLGALGNLWAGAFPQPDPRHARNPFTPGLLLTPPLLLLALWRPAPAALRWFLILALLALVALAAVLSGTWPVERAGQDGLWQRLLGVVVFVPLGLGAAWLRRALDGP